MKEGGSMENKNIITSKASIGMGGSLIITVFVVLCLTIFSVLSFTTAHSDLKLSKKTEEFTKDYYNINGLAEERLAEIYVTLLSVNLTYSNNISSFISNSAEAIASLHGVSVIEMNSDDFILYYETLGIKNQKLCVTLKIMYDLEKKLPYYSILTWNLEPIKLPTYEEENYNLWEGFD